MSNLMTSVARMKLQTAAFVFRKENKKKQKLIKCRRNDEREQNTMTRNSILGVVMKTVTLSVANCAQH